MIPLFNMVTFQFLIDEICSKIVGYLKLHPYPTFHESEATEI